MSNNNETSLGDFTKGVFCLEGEWTGDLGHSSSLEPILQLLRNRDPRFSYIHRFAISNAELKLYLQKWSLKKYKSYSILYLACHGDTGSLFFNSSRRDPGTSLEDLEQLLIGKCRGRIICFGSCGTLDLGGPRIEQFLETTGALAVCGYKHYVDWISSAAFDLMLLAALQANATTIGGMRAVHKRLKREARTLVNNLGFRMVVRKARRRAAKQ